MMASQYMEFSVHALVVAMLDNEDADLKLLSRQTFVN